MITKLEELIQKKTDGEELDAIILELQDTEGVLIVKPKTLVKSQIDKFKKCVVCKWKDEWFIDTTSECWNDSIEPSQLKESGAKVAPKISWLNFKSVLSALLTGEHIPKETQEKRLEICHGCDLFHDDGKNSRCGVCGCKLKGDNTILNLTSYVETEKYGCKHPEGSKWKKNGV